MNALQRLLSNSILAFIANTVAKVSGSILFIMIGRQIGPAEAGVFNLGVTYYTILLGLWAHIKIAYSPRSYSWIDGYVRRRLRWVCLRHWKKPRVIQQKLRALGLPPHQARSISGSRKGPWRLSATAELHRALGNARLARLGLVSMLHLHESDIDRLHRPHHLSLPFD